jgi:hypothetical protein
MPQMSSLEADCFIEENISWTNVRQNFRKMSEEDKSQFNFIIKVPFIELNPS